MDKKTIDIYAGSQDYAIIDQFTDKWNDAFYKTPRKVDEQFWKEYLELREKFVKLHDELIEKFVQIS